ncbi:MAG TPA: hypothetical protein VGP76_11540 [Planctomycetaceae bacterium]|jgi:hypothetical protein|nr:hypothetical protein [Planctomycetaceae bacterium]
MRSNISSTKSYSENPVAGILRLIVAGLADQPNMALAHIWRVRCGDLRSSCQLRLKCPNQPLIFRVARVFSAYG